MERLNFVRNDGVIRLPPGFRFQPTDEEIVFQYLKCKVFSLPLPASIIPEINISHYDPWDLPGEQEYFFYNKEAIKPRQGKRSSRIAGSGYWKATGVDKKIESSSRNERTGMKKTLVFYRGTPSDGSRTDWIMHEYRLVGAETAPTGIFPHTNFSTHQNPSTGKEDWVLCRIFLRKRSTTDERAMIRSHKDNTVENISSCMLSLSSSSSSLSSSNSNSSVITDAPSSGSDREENSDCDSSSHHFYYRKEA